MNHYKRMCQECGRTFYTSELWDSLCSKCMEELGLHGLDFEEEEDDNDDEFGFGPYN